MTPADIDALADAIVTKLFAAPVTIHSYDKPGVPKYDTNFGGWLDFVHGELQQTRIKP